jgi:hypothetical protein
LSRLAFSQVAPAYFSRRLHDEPYFVYRNPADDPIRLALEEAAGKPLVHPKEN